MLVASKYVIPVSAALLTAAAAFSQDPAPKLSARDMFYHPVKTASAGTSTPKATPKAPPTQVAVAQPKQTPPRPVQTPPSQGNPNIIPVALKATPPSEGPALGLKYTLQKKGQKVATDTVFHTGDQVQINIESNQPAYLYIITQGSSGTWKIQVPSAGAPNNRVEAMKAVTFPSGDSAFTFRDPKGSEKVFLILSREPINDTEDQIFNLQGKPKQGGEPAPPPAAQPNLIQARLEIPNDKIAQMRSMYTRDLIIEKVNPETKGDQEAKKEYAMYVVNTTGSPKARLVADISLEHQ